MKMCAVIVFALVVVSSVHAQATFVSGNDFMNKCGDITDKSYDSLSFGFCMGYVEGVSDTIEFRQEGIGADGKKPKAFICFPENVTANQLLRIVQKSIKGEPEHQHWPATALVNNAFVRAFPCK